MRVDPVNVPLRMDPFAAAILIEEADIAAGKAKVCGHTCQCHGGYVCIRGQHPNEPGNQVPHAARLDDGSLHTWNGPCPPERHDPDTGLVLTEDEYEQQRDGAQAARTAHLLASVDMDALVAAVDAHRAKQGETVQ